MNGKSNVFHYLNSTGEKRILVIADGAAFGSEIDRVLQLLKTKKNAVLYLPESFEWLILSSGVLKSSIVENLLKEPSEYIESKEYFSWERFFSALLIEKTKSSYLAYSKRNLNQSYLEEKIKAAILMQMDKIRLDWKISDE